MRLEFTKEDIENEYNKMELEGEDVTLIGEYIEVIEDEENTFTITGDAIIEGELYHEFVTVLKLLRSLQLKQLHRLSGIGLIMYAIK